GSRADALEEHRQLSLGEDDSVDGRPTCLSIGVADQAADEAEVEPTVEVPAEVSPGAPRTPTTPAAARPRPVPSPLSRRSAPSAPRLSRREDRLTRLCPF